MKWRQTETCSATAEGCLCIHHGGQVLIYSWMWNHCSVACKRLRPLCRFLCFRCMICRLCVTGNSLCLLKCLWSYGSHLCWTVVLNMCVCWFRRYLCDKLWHTCIFCLLEKTWPKITEMNRCSRCTGMALASISQHHRKVQQSCKQPLKRDLHGLLGCSHLTLAWNIGIGDESRLPPMVARAGLGQRNGTNTRVELIYRL